MGGLQDFSVSPRPLGFGFSGLGLRGLGPGFENYQKLIIAPYAVMPLPLLTEVVSSKGRQKDRQTHAILLLQKK